MQDFLFHMRHFFITTLVVLSSLTGSFYFARCFAKKGGASDVRTIWYLFFLILTAGLIIVIGASNISVIDAKGEFHGTFGKIIDWLMHFSIDLPTDFFIYGSMLGLVVVPQVLSYIFSGVSGSATEPAFVRRSFIFFSWSIIKSQISASGVFLAISISGFFNVWNGWKEEDMCKMVGLATMLILSSFFIRLFTYEITSTSNAEPQKALTIDESQSKASRISRLRNWMRRHVK